MRTYPSTMSIQKRSFKHKVVITNSIKIAAQDIEMAQFVVNNA
ncbi:MAG: hypothetical protein V4482_06725 [Pseudomonadota bacterium]